MSEEYIRLQWDGEMNHILVSFCLFLFSKMQYIHALNIDI